MCELYTLQYIVQPTMYSEQWSVYCLLCSLYTIYCIVYSVQCKIQCGRLTISLCKLDQKFLLERRIQNNFYGIGYLF